MSHTFEPSHPSIGTKIENLLKLSGHPQAELGFNTWPKQGLKTTATRYCKIMIQHAYNGKHQTFNTEEDTTTTYPDGTVQYLSQIYTFLPLLSITHLLLGSRDCKMKNAD